MSIKFETRTHVLKQGALVTIHEAKPSDAKDLLEFIQQVSAESDFLSFGANEFKLTEDEEADFLKKCQEADNHIYLLATLHDQIVGTLYFASSQRPRVRHSGEFGIVIRQAYWGLGLGGIFLDTLIQWAKRTGFIKKINLKVRKDNVRGIALYKKKGFIHEGTLSNEICIGGKYYDLYAMGLNL